MEQRVRIGYFMNLRIEEQYIGGIMITDASAIPLEFKYTEPIKPTRIHQIIYGKVLPKYISDEVIRKNLLKEIKNVPAFYFVGEPDMVGEDTAAKVPLVAVQKTSLPGLNAIGDVQRVRDKEILVQSGTSTNPLRLVFYTAEPDVQEKVLNAVRSFIDKLDVLEPFNRVENALRSLCQSKS